MTAPGEGLRERIAQEIQDHERFGDLSSVDGTADRILALVRAEVAEAERLMEHWKHLACDPQTREALNTIAAALADPSADLVERCAVAAFQHNLACVEDRVTWDTTTDCIRDRFRLYVRATMAELRGETATTMDQDKSQEHG